MTVQNPDIPDEEASVGHGFNEATLDRNNDIFDHAEAPTPSSLFSSLLGAFRRKCEKDGGMLGYDIAASGGQARRGIGLRRYWRWMPKRFLRLTAYAAAAVPIVLLMILGVLHLLEFCLGTASFVWNGSASYQSVLFSQRRSHLKANLADYVTDVTQTVLPIPCHSHNDYWRPVPLFDALYAGCTGVEADVWLVNGELFVGHNRRVLTSSRTLQSLYINPLVELLNKTNSVADLPASAVAGVFESKPDQPLILLIDFKTGSQETFRVVSQQLQPLREKGYLSYWNGQEVFSRAVTVVASGRAPFEEAVKDKDYRDIFFDAPLDEMWERPPAISDAIPSKGGERADTDKAHHLSLSRRANAGKSALDSVSDLDAFNTSTSYYASTSFAKTIGRIWRGRLSPRQMELIRGQIAGATRRDLKARYWDTPSWPTDLRNHVWHFLVKEGAEMLSVDDLEAAATQDWSVPVHDWWISGHG